MLFRGSALAASTVMMLGMGAAQGQEAVPDAALVQRGEYLARAADCMPCHTAPGGKPYAGGLALNTPFGALYSVNITSDPTTGIGGWTFEQFKGALHDGIRADGAYLYPAMPFDAYTKIPDEDLKALWAYVQTIPPVEAPNPENQLGFPFNIRMGMLAWRELFFAPEYFQPTAGKSDQWNRGAYLVEALGHCSDCHSPRNIMGAIKGKEQFTGSEIDGFYAPALTSAALAKNWTEASLVTFLKTGSAPGKTTVFGPMAEVVQHSTSQLTDADLSATVAYLMDSPPPPDAPRPQQLSPLPADVYQQASRLYVDQCAGCHQPHGTGLAGSVPPLQGNPAVTAAEPYNVMMAVLQGLPPGGAYGAMPSFAGRLSDQQVADLTNYVRTSWGNPAQPNATANMVAAWRATAAVPSYGSEAAEAFDCPKVGGAPGAAGPDADAVAAVTAMLQGGDRNVPDLVDAYRASASDDDPADVVNALISAYCPVVAGSAGPTYARNAELSRFARQVAATVSPQAAAVPFPKVDITWALPVGHTLVSSQPTGTAGRLICPADDGKLVPRQLVADATGILGSPVLPVNGDMRKSLVNALLAKDPKAAPADAANALISAYCRLVTADGSTSEAQQRAWLEGFSDEIIADLQMQTATAR
ncbi:MAG TPA: cytochrome c [Geminicoccus sp.]|jgi:mono/diheme cytochrome c family protein|uniref:cytochrome c n=1 Tax=Geminicoccus sp. TaxID=2024832 RepID=UPI002E2FC931|nr:cytochrome c [Geminicoccus sp.]HEX2528969.1 cytochrome c [Geminicoccus sp.]